MELGKRLQLRGSTNCPGLRAASVAWCSELLDRFAKITDGQTEPAGAKLSQLAENDVDCAAVILRTRGTPSRLQPPPPLTAANARPITGEELRAPDRLETGISQLRDGVRLSRVGN